MTKIVIDKATRKKLHGLAEALMFTDEAGTILGNFTPVPKDRRREPQISQEEIERRLQMGGGRPLTEIMSDLEKRE
jgi:hypothetical protein